MQTSLLRELVVGTPVISATYDRPQKSVNRYLPGPATQCQYSTTTSKQIEEGERLLKVSQCYLSTTSGPGPLAGHMLRIRYKVAIPLNKIKCVNQSQNVQKPTQKYIEIVTEDNFDFWFMGVLKYQKTFKYLEQAVSQA
ncbi:hypothetical protein GLYMA_10G287100v4 [Glycine max]|uniref:Uncharacterized protein n=1 Tax=Glycine max TaxID=3847 RepID=A0A0R0I860_SOYBN|nr:hypothetical protein GYH30_029447 [Glycine max]KRH36155.1 hypothetical protein GLYMA_10G287100v4 [Glycine max]